MPAVRFRIEGADLNRVYRSLRQVEPKAAAAVRKGIREAARPIITEIRAEAQAQAMPRAADATKVRFSSTQRGMSATIAVDHNAAPYARPLELGSQGARGRFNRHPVFGHDVYVNQPLRPFFWPAINRTSAQVGQRLRAAIDAAFRV